jgi:hypothetical protein
MESARLIAVLTRIVSDVAVVEDLPQDALVAALEHWRELGIPPKRFGKKRDGILTDLGALDAANGLWLNQVSQIRMSSEQGLW